MFTLLTLILSVAYAGGCADLLTHLDAVARAGEHLYESVRPGEVITIGPLSPQIFDWNAVNLDDGMIEMFSIHAPVSVRLLEEPAQGFAKVQMLDGNFERLIVPINDLTTHDAPEVRQSRFNSRLKALASPVPKFRRGERIRQRVDGRMKLDRFNETAPGQYTLTGPSPSTIIHGSRRRMLQLASPTGPHLTFMNAVARWTSRPEFRALAAKDQLTLLAQLTVNMNAFHNS